MDSQKQVLPFEHKQPEYDACGNFLDVASYLSAVRNELEAGEKIVYSKCNKRKIKEISNENSDNGTDSITTVSDIVDAKRNGYDHTLIEPNYWRKEFIKSFKSMKAQFNISKPTEVYLKNIPNNFTNWRAFMINNEPNNSLLFTLNKSEVLRLVVYLKKLLNDKSVKGCMSQWIIGLFFRLPEILDYSDIFILRDLAKKLVLNRILKKLVTTETTMISEMVIVIICSIYGQKDLLPDDLI